MRTTLLTPQEVLADRLYAEIRSYKLDFNPKHLTTIKSIADELEALNYHAIYVKRDESIRVVRRDIYESRQPIPLLGSVL